MGTSGWDRRMNLDGVISFSGTKLSSSYTQLYRNGIGSSWKVFQRVEGRRQFKRGIRTAHT
jgi:hypothetical protein